MALAAEIDIDQFRPHSPNTFFGFDDDGVPFEVEFVESEVPAGIIDGVNLNFTIAKLPLGGSFKLYRNLRLREGVDFTRTGQDIVMGLPPESTDVFVADYRAAV